MKIAKLGVVFCMAVLLLCFAGYLLLRWHDAREERKAEVARKRVVAAEAGVAGRAVFDAYERAEASEAAYLLASNAAEAEVRSYQRIAVTPEEKDFTSYLYAQMRNASICREFMTTVSIETYRINKPCAEEALPMIDWNRKGIAMIEAEK
jgi:hypothetical protein